MATIDQLMAAFGAFGQAAQEYGATKGIQDATLAVQELKKNTEMDYQQRIAAQGQIANQLQAGLAGLNAPQAQIAAAVGAVAPPKITNSTEALSAAQQAADPKEREQLLKQASQFSTLEGKQDLERQKPLLDYQYGKEFALASMKARNDLLAKISDAAKELPADVKKYTETLGSKVGNQTSIANTLATAVEQWDAATDDSSRLQIGREILKTINSPEGADAVGAEEVKRLGAKLEFAMGNLFSSNELQMGRDLEGFRVDLATAQNRVAESVNKNRDMVERAIKEKRIPNVKLSGGSGTVSEKDLISLTSKRGTSTSTVAGPQTVDPVRKKALEDKLKKLRGE